MTRTFRSGGLPSKSLTDQTLLASLAAAKIDSHVRCVAIRKINDQALFAKLAVDEKDLFIRQAAVEKLTDRTLLAKIATGTDDPRPRGRYYETGGSGFAFNDRGT